MNEIYCGICHEIMPVGICGYWDHFGHGMNAHIGCFESPIQVYKIQAIGGGSYFDIEPPPMADLLDGVDTGEGYIVTKEEMSAGMYYTLPEFEGF